MAIEAILFDADGVIQRPAPQWRAGLAGIVGDDHVDAFAADVFAAEDRCVAGAGDFRAEVAAVLARWGSDRTPEHVLAALNAIRVDAAVLATVAALRGAGLTCCLATNQQVHRASHMSTTLDYARHFDREFYSCHLGAAKPAHAFFDAVLDALDVAPPRAAFVDDRPENVAAAEACGLRAAHFAPNSGARNLARVLGALGFPLP